MKETTLIYLHRPHQTLMLLRNKKKDDLNSGKWIGIGGKLEAGESPYEGAKRETYEETHYIMHSARFVGTVLFIDLTRHYEEKMYVYTSEDFSGEMHACDEGELHWIDDEKLSDLPMWEADPYFLSWLKDEKVHQAKATYQNDHLLSFEETQM